VAPTASDTLAMHRGDPLTVAELLTLPGAVLHGHFELLSGLHTDRFLAFSRIAKDSRALGKIADWLIPSLASQAPTALIAPSTAGVALGWALAQRLAVPLHLASLDASGRPDGVVGSPDLTGHRVALINDVVTTGTGLTALAETTRQAGAAVAAAAWFVSRASAPVAEQIDAPAMSIADVDMPAWHKRDCSLCTGDTLAQQALDLN
jgi:orotate phosphoribosyltransferase